MSASSNAPSLSPATNSDAVAPAAAPEAVHVSVDAPPHAADAAKPSPDVGRVDAATDAAMSSPDAALRDISPNASERPPDGAKPRARPPVVPFTAMFRFATRTDKAMYAIACVCAAAGGLVFPGFMLLYADLLNVLNTPGKALADEAARFALWFTLIAIGAGLGAFAEVALPMIAAERQMHVTRVSYFSSLLRQDAAWHDTHRAGEVVSRLAEDTVAMTAGMGNKITETIRCTVTFLAGLIIGFTRSWQLTLIVIGVLPFIVIAMTFLKIITESVEARIAAAYARAGDAATETLSQIRAVVAYGGEEAEVARYEGHLRRAEKNSAHKGWAIGFAVGSLFSLIFIAYGAGCFLGARLIIASREANPSCRFDPTGSNCFTGATIVTTFGVVIIGAFALGQAAPNIAAIAAAQAAAWKIFQIIDRKPSVDVYSTVGAKPALSAGSPSIEYRNVTFAYPSRPDEVILRNFSLRVEPGTTVALVGASGSGKSTLMHLLMRCYDPQQGCVLVDGVDVKEWNLQYLRDRIASVSQEPTLFGVSVRDNIAFGAAAGAVVTTTDIEAAARAANAHEFIVALPDGYDTVVGSSVSSTLLSGGQRQRVCIARAILRNAPILLLDEATSALDSQSERQVQAALDNLTSSSNRRTSLIIAHRLSTVAHATVIVVMERGSIVQRGTHDELMAQPDGIYAQLRALQDTRTGADGAGATVAAAGNAASIMPASNVPGKVVNAAAADIGEAEFKRSAADAQSVPLSRVWAQQRPEAFVLALGLAAACASGIVQPIFAIIYSSMISLFYSRDEDLRDGANFFVGLFMAVAFGLWIATVVRIGAFVYAGEKLTRRLRVLAYRSVLRQDMAFFDAPENAGGRITTRLASDAQEVKGATGESLSMVVQAFAAIIASLVIALDASWRLGLVVLSIMPLMVFSSYLQGRAFKGYSLGAARALEDAGHIASESVIAYRTISAFNLQRTMTVAFTKRLDSPLRAGYGKALSAGLGLGFTQGILFAGYAVAFYAGGVFISQGTLSFAGLMRVFLAITMGAQAAGSAMNWGPDRAKAALAVRSLFQLIDRTPSIDALAVTGNRGSDHPHKIEFRNVSFAYPSRPDRMVLKNFSIVIPPGQRFALVGPSGCGKSTILQLLLRFYDPTSGDILLDDAPLRSYNVRWLRSQFGLVAQEPALFADSIRYNIEYGRAHTKPACDQGVPVDADAAALSVAMEPVPDDVQHAATLANASEFVSRFKHGFYTHCGARGSQLSGGQRQRIAIARAAIRKPAVLCCDEATSALDSQSEVMVQAALDQVMRSATGASGSAVVIAHRLSSILDSDLILVLEHGELVQTGTHAQLVATPGLYRTLAAAQNYSAGPST